MRPARRRFGLAAALVLGVAPLAAQELEPRAYAPNPTGANFVLLAYAHSTGDVVFDPSVPITDVSAHVNAGALFYGRTFGLFGRSASAAVQLPYVWGHIEGNVFEERRDVYRSGLADLRLRLTASLLGGPALPPREFAQRHPRTTLGASVVVVAPTGQYDPSKLVNVGTNRWAFKPEVGLSHPAGRWFLELYAGTWLFTVKVAMWSCWAISLLLMPSEIRSTTSRSRLVSWVAWSGTEFPLLSTDSTICVKSDLVNIAGRMVAPPATALIVLT